MVTMTVSFFALPSSVTDEPVARYASTLPLCSGGLDGLSRLLTGEGWMGVARSEIPGVFLPVTFSICVMN